MGDAGPSDTQLTVALSVTNGTLTLGTISGISIPVGSNASASMTLVGTAAAINTALDGLSYQTSVYNDDMLLVTVDDAGTIASGSNQAADSVDLAVSQPSVNVPGAQSTALNTALVFSSANENAITVADTGPSDTQLTVTLSVSTGTLTLDTTDNISISAGTNASATMTIVGTAANINTALNGLQFITAVSSDDTFSISADDSASIAADGQEQASDYVDISLLGPTLNVPGAQSTTLNTPLVFTGANSNTITVGDSGPADTVLTVALSVTNGTLALATTDNLIMTNGANGAASMTFTGIATAINTALYGLSFNSNVTGNDSLQITVNDPNTLSSHEDQASNSVPIYVSNLKAVGDSATTTLNTAVAIPVLANDTGATSIVSTTDPSNGTVSISGSTITYTPNADFSGPDVFSYKITDGHGNYSEASVNVSVSDVTPEDLCAVDDSATTAIGTPITIDVLGQRLRLCERALYSGHSHRRHGVDERHRNNVHAEFHLYRDRFVQLYHI